MRTLGTRALLSLLGLALPPLLSGCAAGPRPLAAEDLARIRRDPRITGVLYQPPPPFRHGTSTGAGMGLFGPVGAAIAEQQARASGERVRGQIGLADPTFRVKDRFLEELSQALGSGLILDFRTLHWGIGAISNPFRANRYAVGYIGRARLIRLDERKVLWQADCLSGTRDKQKATLDALREHEGRLLKAWLTEAADLCAEQLLGQFLGKACPGGRGE